MCVCVCDHVRVMFCPMFNIHVYVILMFVRIYATVVSAAAAFPYCAHCSTHRKIPAAFDIIILYAVFLPVRTKSLII